MKTTTFIKNIISGMLKPIKWYFRVSAKNYEKLYGPDYWKYNIPFGV